MSLVRSAIFLCRVTLAIAEENMAQPRWLRLAPSYSYGHKTLTAAGFSNRPDFIVFVAGYHIGKTLKPEPANASVTSCISIGIRKSDIMPYFYVPQHKEYAGNCLSPDARQNA